MTRGTATSNLLVNAPCWKTKDNVQAEGVKLQYCIAYHIIVNSVTEHRICFKRTKLGAHKTLNLDYFIVS